MSFTTSADISRTGMKRGPSVVNLKEEASYAASRIHASRESMLSLVEQEYLEFERVQQAKLQEDIAKIRALIAEAEGPSDSSESALEGWIESLKGLSEQFGNRKQVDEGLTRAEREMGELWSQYHEDAAQLVATLCSERDRQRTLCQKRLAEKALQLMRSKVTETNALLEARRGSMRLQITEIENHFRSVIGVHERVWRFAHNLHEHHTHPAVSPTADPELELQSDVVEPDVAAEAAPVVEWVRFVDDETGCPYFVNTVTGESTWDNPYGESSDDAFVAPYDPDDPANATYWAVLSGDGSDVPIDAVITGGKVSMSDYEIEKQRTEELSRELATLEAELGKLRAKRAQSALNLLECLMEETPEDKISSIHEEFDVDRKRLMIILTAERDRQRQKLVDRLHHKLEQKKSELDVMSPKRR